MTTENTGSEDLTINDNIEESANLEGDEDTTSEDFESTPSEEVIEEDNTEIQRYKVKVDGEEVEVDLDELLKGYQTNKAGQHKLQQAAQLRKQAESFIEMLRTNPLQVLQDPSLGLDVRGLAEQYLVEQLQEEMMSPEDREVRDMKRKLQEYEAAEKEKADAAEKQKLEELMNHYQEDYTNQIMGSLEKSGLPKNETTIARMAHYMFNVISNPDLSDEVKNKITFDDVADLVKQDWQKEIQSLLGTSNVETLIQLVGDDGIKKIRNWDVSRIKQPKKQPTQHVNKTKTPKKEENKMSMDEFKEYLNSLK